MNINTPLATALVVLGALTALMFLAKFFSGVRVSASAGL